jgi:hypothetical protein
MKRYTFTMEDGSIQHVVARTFKDACLAWDQFGLDPRKIESMIIHD